MDSKINENSTSNKKECTDYVFTKKGQAMTLLVKSGCKKLFNSASAALSDLCANTDGHRFTSHCKNTEVGCLSPFIEFFVGFHIVCDRYTSK